ncbi:MAG: class I SAM-dependent methyltransferase [Lewinellaceae bacterium]|nr:class I SAM-dependent methyltransferase [Lewinellaceae bacterium]
MMKSLLRALKKIWLFRFLRRIYLASTYFNHKYIQIIKWGFNSNETSNFTYKLTQSNLAYLSFTVSAVLNENYQTVRAYIDEAQNDTALREHILETTRNSSQRKFADEKILFGRRLGWYAFVRALKPKLVIETGVDKGLGSVLLCAALLKNAEEGFPGKYLGTDINPEAGYLLAGRYAEVGKILYGDSIESLSKIEEPIDLFINDSDHSISYEYREYEVIHKLLTARSIILSDNAHVSGSLADFSLKTGRHFLYFQEEPENHWYPGAGIGISFSA